jgi:hypothetical protein
VLTTAGMSAVETLQSRFVQPSKQRSIEASNVPLDLLTRDSTEPCHPPGGFDVYINLWTGTAKFKEGCKNASVNLPAGPAELKHIISYFSLSTVGLYFTESPFFFSSPSG